MVWRKILPNPDKNQVVRVEKGERIYFDLEEDVDAGYRWDFTCDDNDVEVTLDHEPPDGGDEGRGKREEALDNGQRMPVCPRAFSFRRVQYGLAEDLVES